MWSWPNSQSIQYPSTGLPVHINIRMVCYFFIRTYMFTCTSKYHGNIWLRTISTNTYLHSTLPFIQTWWCLTDPHLLKTISRFNNLVRLFWIDNERHWWLVKIEPLRWEKTPPLSIIWIRITRNANQTLSADAILSSSYLDKLPLVCFSFIVWHAFEHHTDSKKLW